jgi:hypothetical protein
MFFLSWSWFCYLWWNDICSSLAFSLDPFRWVFSQLCASSCWGQPMSHWLPRHSCLYRLRPPHHRIRHCQHLACCRTECKFRGPRFWIDPGSFSALARHVKEVVVGAQYHQTRIWFSSCWAFPCWLLLAGGRSLTEPNEQGDISEAWGFIIIVVVVIILSD